ncbi:conserved hypothetical protein [Culex quinquefasciatus]|uniref:G-protein coupled receptors family 1 profile domain-containing protein n=1 Tax=Culex quinquefasciatus TaxID=7176 RepID=B0X681_CULQU|nr:conserved hypothetical protein [Culex quinquefasciatus]|eukprot:XP_001865153.1 conserved hypothetical protein [Culex quinquefasciatus]
MGHDQSKEEQVKQIGDQQVTVIENQEVHTEALEQSGTVSVTVSVLTLTFISIDRWYAICFPLRYKPRPERAWRSIAVIWLIGFLSDLPEFLVLTTRRKKLRFDIKLFTQCVATWDNEKEKTFYIVKFVFLYS